MALDVGPRLAQPNRYRAQLQTAVASSAASYGYTLTIWTTGAVMTHSQGIPTGFEAILFLIGAVAGFAAVGGVAHGSISGLLLQPETRNVRLWGGFHLPSVGLSVGAATVVTALFHGSLAWPLDGFIVTVIYLSVVAAQFTIADKSEVPAMEIERK